MHASALHHMEYQKFWNIPGMSRVSLAATVICATISSPLSMVVSYAPINACIRKISDPALLWFRVVVYPTPPRCSQTLNWDTLYIKCFEILFECYKYYYWEEKKNYKCDFKSTGLWIVKDTYNCWEYWDKKCLIPMLQFIFQINMSLSV